MTSYFSQLYLDIQQRIKTEVPEIAWIEQDFGQDVFDKWRPNVAFPAVLIDFPSADYENIAGMGQTAVVTIHIRLLVAPFQQSYEAAPIEIRKEALSYFDLEQKLVDALHGWEPSLPLAGGAGEEHYYSQALTRTRITSNNRNDIGLRIRELQFTTAYDEQ